MHSTASHISRAMPDGGEWGPLRMLEQNLLERLLAEALERGGDYADVFCERRSATSFRLQSGRIHESTLNVTTGVGVRVIVGESAGYAYSDDLSTQALMRAAQIASLIARTGKNGAREIRLSEERVKPLYDVNRTGAAESSAYVSLLERAERAGRNFDSRVVAVNGHVSDEVQDVWIATSDG